jgi:Predicted membrane protein
MYIIQFIRGFCMALADSVPGVSGGTVAFLLGFYDQFIDSIDDLITGNMEKKKTAFFFLIKLGIGWVTGMVLAILILANVFESHIYAISSLFIGFIIFAIPIVVREELDTLKGNMHIARLYWLGQPLCVPSPILIRLAAETV